MENKAKIRINLDTREFEIEGTEGFVNSHTDKIEGFFGTVKQISAAGRAGKSVKAGAKKRGRKPGLKAAATTKAPVAIKEVKTAAPKKAAGKRGRPAKAAAAPKAKVIAKPVAKAPVVKAAAKPAKVVKAKAAKAPKAAKVAKPKVVKAAKPKLVKVAKPKVVKAAKPKVVKAAKPKVVRAKAPKAPKVEVKVTPEFVAFFKRVPKGAKDIDKMLAASLFVQNASGGVQFTAKEVNGLLSSQGVKLSNAAQYVKNSIKTNRMTQLDRGKFKLTNDGIAHVNSFLAK